MTSGCRAADSNPLSSRFRPGTAVTWTFDDGGVEHNVVGDGWQSDVQASGTYQRTFTQPGSYPYACTLHVGMDGRVEVVDG
jgi:plastocyanin